MSNPHFPENEKIFSKIIEKCLTNAPPFVIITHALGRLAQLARASAWRAEGHRFESYIVHQIKKTIQKDGLFYLVRYGTRTHLNADVRWTSAATSSKTGGYISFLQSKKVIESGCPERKKEEAKASSILLFFLFINHFNHQIQKLFHPKQAKERN